MTRSADDPFGEYEREPDHAMDFARRYHYDVTFRRRVDALVDCYERAVNARLVGDTRAAATAATAHAVHSIEQGA